MDVFRLAASKKKRHQCCPRALSQARRVLPPFTASSLSPLAVCQKKYAFFDYLTDIEDISINFKY